MTQALAKLQGNCNPDNADAFTMRTMDAGTITTANLEAMRLCYTCPVRGACLDEHRLNRYALLPVTGYTIAGAKLWRGRSMVKPSPYLARALRNYLDSFIDRSYRETVTRGAK